jgi:hypothetical protein
VPGGSIKTGGCPAQLRGGGQTQERARPGLHLAPWWCAQAFGRHRALCGTRLFVVDVVFCAGEAADLAVAEHVVAEGEDFAGDGDARDLAAAAFGDPFVLGSEWTAAGGGVGRLRTAPSAGSWSLGGRCARGGLCLRSCGRSGSDLPPAQVPGGRELFDLADLGDDQHPRAASDPADLAVQLLVNAAGGCSARLHTL